MVSKSKTHKMGDSGSQAVAEPHSFDESALYVGIDLGTSRTAISTSNGMREVIPTYVGYSKDNISEELLGAEPLFGDEALKHRMSVDLVRPLEHGVIQEKDGGNRGRNLKASQELVQHLLRQAKPKPGQPVYGVIGAPARASVASKKILIDAARGILDAVMIVSEPFSVAYGMGVLDRALVIDIGAGTTDLCRLHGTLPTEEDQITLDLAGDYVDQKLFKLISKRYPKAQLNINMVRGLKERYGFVSQNADQITARFPVGGRPTDFDITKELREACHSIVPEMVDAIGQLIATYDPEFQEAIRSQVILAGGGSQMIGLDRMIEQGMEVLGGGRVKRVEEPAFAGANGALKMAQRMPAHFWKVLS